jgi:hypothetical protein
MGSKWLYSFVVPILAGCSASASHQATENSARGSQAIIHGSPSSAEQDAVVVLTTFRDGVRRSLCSATLVAPNLIITARHCVSDTDTTTACTKEGTPIAGAIVKGERAAENLVVFVGQDGLAPSTEDVANGSARGAEVIAEPVTTVCNNDVAFVVLDTKLAAPIAPIRLGPPVLDEKLAAVGWGIDETGTLPASREVRSDVTMIGVGPALYPEHATYGYGDREFMLGESACSGDSGGPALAKSGAVVGVAARAGNGKPRDPANLASTCMGATAHAVYTHLGAIDALATRAFTRAGEPMWLEGQPDPRAAPAMPPPSNPLPASPPPAPAALPAADAPPAAVALAASASGCSIVSASDGVGAVEHAAGFVALLSTLLGLRRRLRAAAP